MFAFARPLFQVLEDSPEFFVAREQDRRHRVFALGMAFLAPTVMVALEAALPARGRPAGAHLVFVALLAAAIVLQVLDGLASGPALLLIGAALALGVAAAWAYARTRLAPASSPSCRH